ncbi:MAG: hypothetical protein DRP60_13510 [Spirochaetes bacterium]|nr:MAG: hypothetical protein DRP60_13510 [Spirochaetota bacterium]
MIKTGTFHMSQNIKIDNWITEHPVVVEASETLKIAVEKMADHHIGAVLVMRKETLVGILTERDLLKLLARGKEKNQDVPMNIPVENIMTADPVTADISEDYNIVYMKMKTHNIRHIPVVSENRVMGIVSIRDLIHFYQNKLETAFVEAQKETEELRKIIEMSSSGQLDKLFAEINRYKELSLTDYLTGLYNKRYFQTRFNEEVSRAGRSQTDLSLLFCDIDFFKKVNDAYGHPAGDEVLRKTAKLLTGMIDQHNVFSRLRKTDIVARYGGEEFVIILPETSAEGAVQTAGKMRQAVEENSILIDSTEIKITMSFGVAELSDSAVSCEEIIRQADSAMYQAKNSGRNKVVLYSGKV